MGNNLLQLRGLCRAHNIDVNGQPTHRFDVQKNAGATFEKKWQTAVGKMSEQCQSMDTFLQDLRIAAPEHSPLSTDPVDRIGDLRNH